MNPGHTIFVQLNFSQMCLSGSAFILAVTLIRALTTHRLPKGAYMALWYVAILRLWLPVSAVSRFSLYTWLPSLATLSSERKVSTL